MLWHRRSYQRTSLIFASDIGTIVTQKARPGGMTAFNKSILFCVTQPCISSSAQVIRVRDSIAQKKLKAKLSSLKVFHASHIASSGWLFAGDFEFKKKRKKNCTQSKMTPLKRSVNEALHVSFSASGMFCLTLMVS